MAEDKTKKEKAEKAVLEREYIVPLRREWLKVPKFKRANKAVKALKQFIARHMKIYDRDLNKVRVDILLNNEIRFRGMRKPPASIKVKAIKYDSGIVDVKLVNIPKHIEFELARKAKKEVESLKKAEEQKKEKAKEEVEQKTKEEAKEEKKKEGEEKKEEKEKIASSKEAELKIEQNQAKQMKHTSKTSQEAPIIQRKSLKK